MEKLRIVLSILVVMVVIALPTGLISANSQTRAGVSEILASSNPSGTSPIQYFPSVVNAGTSCHFGIAVINSPQIPFLGYNLATLGVGNYLDWTSRRNPSVPANIDYYNVISVSDAAYKTNYDNLPNLLAKYPGATWLVGNEPDSEVTYQDHIRAETYADRFYNIATYIRSHDSLAKIAFGTIIQPTAIRIHYMTLAMNRLIADAGSADQAHALIDVYSIHSFILNEQQMYYPPNPVAQSWGAGLPIGYDASWGAPEVIDIPAGETYKTYDINIFEQRVINFRQWMKDQGDPNKPLWITEYGSLFPSKGNQFLQVSDTDTANYMTQTFDFMLGHKDPNLGYAADDNRLVQKWDWFSLNEQLEIFGGSFFDPYTRLLTPVGQRFIQYNPSTADVPIQNPDVYVQMDSFSLTSFSPTTTPGLVTYKFKLQFGNYVSSDRSTGVQIDIKDGSNSIFSTQTIIPRCSGSFDVDLMLNMVPGSVHTFTAQANLLSGNGADINLANNQAVFGPITLSTPPPYQSISTYIPLAFR